MTNKYKNKVPVFFTVDDYYLPYLTVTLKSLIDHSKKINKYDIYIVHNQLSDESKRIIRKLVKGRENFFLHFPNVSVRLQHLSIQLDTRDYYSISTYYRLFLPELFPLIKKAVYIDSDIVLRRDVADLYATELGDNYLGAVPDASVQIIPEFQKYVKTVLGMRHEEYFNAGVLVMNFKALRDVQFEKQAITLLSNVSFKVAQDQDILNFLCQGHVTFVDAKWNVMPLGEKADDPYLIHYNLIYKPWKHKNIMYEDYFWDIANKLNISVYLIGAMHMIPEEYAKKDFEGVEMVKKLCLVEAEKADTFYAYLRTKEDKSQKGTNLFSDTKFEGVNYPVHNEKRKEILAKIVELEKQGKFDVDVEDDPPSKPLEPEGLDFLRKKIVNKAKSYVANFYSFRYFNHLIDKGEIIIDDYKGVENLKDLNSGAVITLNHFNPFDSIPLHKITKKVCRNRKLFKVIKEGNYSYPGLYGFFMRNCNTIPLSSNFEVLKLTLNAIDTVLTRGDLLLIYPEQSMWWNYRKPKPLKPGAFRFASKNNVPVLPCFITMRDTANLDKDGYPIQAYTLHISAPIYPNPTLTIAQNVEMLAKENERIWKEIYEKEYGIPLTYEK